MESIIPIATVIVISAAIAVVIYFFAYLLKRGRNLFWQMMRDANAAHKTAFPTDPSGMHLVLSGGGGQAFVFDPTSRKIFFLTSPRECKGEVLDFNYIRYWVVQSETGFVANTLVHKNVRIEFFTNDIHRPIISPLQTCVFSILGISWQTVYTYSIM